MAYDSEKMSENNVVAALVSGNLGPVVHGLVHRISPWPWVATRAVMISDSQYLESDASFIASAPAVIARLVKMVVEEHCYYLHARSHGPSVIVAPRLREAYYIGAMRDFSIDPEDYRLMLERLGAKK